MTLTDVVGNVVHGWMIDKRISIPAIISVITAAVMAAFFLSDVKNDGKANAKDIIVLRQELDDQKAFTRAIPMISERVGRLEATVAASVSRQERQFEDIMGAIKQNGSKNSAPVRRP